MSICANAKHDQNTILVLRLPSLISNNHGGSYDNDDYLVLQAMKKNQVIKVNIVLKKRRNQQVKTGSFLFKTKCQ